MSLWQEDKENNDIDYSFKFTDLSLKVIQIIPFRRNKFVFFYKKKKKLIDELNTIINNSIEDEASLKKNAEYKQVN